MGMPPFAPTGIINWLGSPADLSAMSNLNTCIISNQPSYRSCNTLLGEACAHTHLSCYVAYDDMFLMSVASNDCVSQLMNSRHVSKVAPHKVASNRCGQSPSVYGTQRLRKCWLHNSNHADSKGHACHALVVLAAVHVCGVPPSTIQTISSGSTASPWAPCA